MVNHIKKTLIILVSFFTPILVLAEESKPVRLAPAEPITAKGIHDFMIITANFLYAVSMIAAIMVFVISGIMYLTAGVSENSVKKAKEMFRKGVWGVLIILGSGVIINTIGALITGEFFS